jgi:RNA polymerase sigma-32 factor
MTNKRRSKKTLNKISTPVPKMPKNESEGLVPLVTLEPLQQYLAEINRYPLLSREEEETLTKAYYETRDPKLASRIVTANLRLVVKIALDFQKFWMKNFSDLVQEGNIGLMQAVKKFDPYKNVKFSYYSSFWIKAYILKFVMDNWRLVKIGTTQVQRKLFYNLRKEKNRILALGFEPVPKLISDRLNVPEKDVIEMEQRMGSWELSINAPVKDDSENKCPDFFATDETSVETSVAREEIRDSLKEHLAVFEEQLRGKERVIFVERLLTEEPKTLQELGTVFGISRERVRQIEARLKKKLRTFLQKRIPDLSSYPEGIEDV